MSDKIIKLKNHRYIFTLLCLLTLFIAGCKEQDNSSTREREKSKDKVNSSKEIQEDATEEIRDDKTIFILIASYDNKIIVPDKVTVFDEKGEEYEENLEVDSEGKASGRLEPGKYVVVVEKEGFLTNKYTVDVTDVKEYTLKVELQNKIFELTDYQKNIKSIISDNNLLKDEERDNSYKNHELSIFFINSECKNYTIQYTKKDLSLFGVLVGDSVETALEKIQRQGVVYYKEYTRYGIDLYFYNIKYKGELTHAGFNLDDRGIITSISFCNWPEDLRLSVYMAAVDTAIRNDIKVIEEWKLVYIDKISSYEDSDYTDGFFKVSSDNHPDVILVNMLDKTKAIEIKNDSQLFAEDEIVLDKMYDGFSLDNLASQIINETYLEPKVSEFHNFITKEEAIKYAREHYNLPEDTEVFFWAIKSPTEDDTRYVIELKEKIEGWYTMVDRIYVDGITGKCTEYDW